MMSQVYDARKQWEVDDLLVWPDLWVTAHVFSSKLMNSQDRVSWLDFRLIEIESFGMDNETILYETPLYPSTSIRRPSPPQLNARDAGDLIADGYLKWDGCMQLDLSHHTCTLQQWKNVAEAVCRMQLWAKDTLGFEIDK